MTAPAPSPMPQLALSTGPAISGARQNVGYNANWNAGNWDPFGRQQQQGTIMGLPIWAIIAAGAALLYLSKGKKLF
ncbi:hypothetical protein [Polycladidibacter hongkongensis]|uniref:hypothetical protein n=1 Tax=Polycladidibacter hongkongensis TaxID=1647556 RepID=UPI00082FE4D2|nr:hypothetical protein [Pseudovibrio hongkongensis]